MKLTVDELGNGIRRLSLKGRMDIEGVDEIDLRLVAETAAQKALMVIDLTQVDFLASVGIGVLVRSAKALRLRGGEAVLVSTVPLVTMTLEKTHIDEVIRMFSDLDSACRSLMGAAGVQAGTKPA